MSSDECHDWNGHLSLGSMNLSPSRPWLPGNGVTHRLVSWRAESLIFLAPGSLGFKSLPEMKAEPCDMVSKQEPRQSHKGIWE